eukprot:m.162641 g.162641  ORF g.162641 m.162641 type:complete len:197 (+) comp17670_c1_seq1:303-893(+)
MATSLRTLRPGRCAGEKSVGQSRTQGVVTAGQRRLGLRRGAWLMLLITTTCWVQATGDDTTSAPATTTTATTPSAPTADPDATTTTESMKAPQLPDETHMGDNARKKHHYSLGGVNMDDQRTAAVIASLGVGVMLIAMAVWLLRGRKNSRGYRAVGAHQGDTDFESLANLYQYENRSVWDEEESDEEEETMLYSRR